MNYCWVLLGMHKAPELVQLAFNDMEVAPQGKHHQAAVWSGSLHPCATGVFVDLDNTSRRPDRIACRQCPHRPLKNRWVCVQVQVSCPLPDRPLCSARPASRLSLAMTTAVFDQLSLGERASIIPAAPIRTVERLPVHVVLLDEVTLLHRACNN